jgi:proton-dependent oligopeptide transporter, POT family
MFKNHPKGLLVAFFSNMGERFGFYTMMAILVLFLQAKYGLTESQAGGYYSWFYFGIYALALVGGIIADATRKYKFVILAGIVVMFAGYVIMAVPGNPLAITLAGLFTIAFGNGLFKGNLQAVVGQMYDDPRYSKVRDTAFMIFYMGINIGAFFAPFVATGIRNWFLKTQGFLHDGSLPAMCHAYTSGSLENTQQFQSLANQVSGQHVADLTVFAGQYIDAFSKGYNYAFGIAAVAMVISLGVYVMFNRYLPTVSKVEKSSKDTGGAKGNLSSFLLGGGLMVTTSVIFYFLLRNSVKDAAALGAAVGLFVGFIAIMFQISTKEERPKVTSLILVFFVVIFFWMSFHQNGLTQTFFARDYTVKEVGPFTNIFFELESILTFIAGLAGIVLLFNKKRSNKYIGAAMTLVFGGLTWHIFNTSPASNPIAPEVFQSFNPLFIVSLTFPVMAVFTWLRSRNMEPSTPRKIGIGMVIAALGFLVILIGSIGLVSPHELQYIENGVTKYNPVPDSSRVLPYWLMSSYLILTIAELFLSPMGLSFVSKVAPARFQGLMQGGWLLATAVGNKFLFIGSEFWGKLDLWQLWLIFIVCCLLSAAFIFSILKRLERSTR